MKKIKVAIAIGFGAVLFSNGFTSFANTNTTQTNVESNQPTLRRWSHAVNIFQNDPHNKWYISHNTNKYNNKVIAGMQNGSGKGRYF